MAVRGRKPTPPEAKAARGTQRADRPQDAPDFKSGEGALKPPTRWKKGGPEREEWDRIVPELVRCHIAKAVHQGALEKICELYASGVVLYERQDYTQSRMIAAEYRKALNEFGLTAASAGRVGGASALGSEDEEAEGFFTGPKAVTG